MNNDTEHKDHNDPDKTDHIQDADQKGLMEVRIKVSTKEAPKGEESHHAREETRGDEPHQARDEELQHAVVAVFDDNDRLLEVVPLKDGTARLAVPREQEGRVVRTILAPGEEGIKTPSLARLRRNQAIEERVVLRPDLELTINPDLIRRWKRSCCRVRGRVFMKVTLPNGTVQERPLCNARVIICEVDASIRRIIHQLPHNLVYRLRDEWLKAVRSPRRRQSFRRA